MSDENSALEHFRKLPTAGDRVDILYRERGRNRITDVREAAYIPNYKVLVSQTEEIGKKLKSRWIDALISVFSQAVAQATYMPEGIPGSFSIPIVPMRGASRIPLKQFYFIEEDDIEINHLANFISYLTRIIHHV